MIVRRENGLLKYTRRSDFIKRIQSIRYIENNRMEDTELEREGEKVVYLKVF